MSKEEKEEKITSEVWKLILEDGCCERQYRRRLDERNCQKVGICDRRRASSVKRGCDSERSNDPKKDQNLPTSVITKSSAIWWRQYSRTRQMVRGREPVDSPSLAGKSKLFFMNACRGEKLLLPHLLYKTSSTSHTCQQMEHFDWCSSSCFM